MRHRHQVNRWKIPEELERKVIARDAHCVYCGVVFLPFSQSRKTRPSWEHIVNDQRIVTLENVARCCISCNASKEAKRLSDWLESNYCKRRSITKDTVAAVVKMALTSPPT